MSNIVGINAYRVNLPSLKQSITANGYRIRETPHFLVCVHTEAPTLLVHWFAPKAIDADLGYYFMQELKPLGILEQPQNFGDAFGAIVGSIFPHEHQRAWHLYGTNTLQRYHQLLTEPNQTPRCDFPVDVFTSLYKRVCELQAGNTVLDAGCSFGLLPLLLAERIPSLTTVVGIDIEADPFTTTRQIAQERHLKSVQFVQADLLSDDMNKLGHFDTVTLLHVLEHFTEEEMYQVLTNLLKITSQRLIIAVPYETGEPETAYGHKQLFSRNKLEAVGQWCIERLGGGSLSYEDCVGGLLIVDRHQASQIGYGRSPQTLR